jgi:pimeloyl-ACP methyl ester carboxylesterase
MILVCGREVGSASVSCDNQVSSLRVPATGTPAVDRYLGSSAEQTVFAAAARPTAGGPPDVDSAANATYLELPGVLRCMDGETRQVEVGAHRIEATVFGSGTPAVVIEPGFGGTAASWRAVAEAVAEDTTVVTYDRAPYGASSRAQDARTPRDIARDLNGVLDALGIDGPVILAAHSAGGLYARMFARLYDDQVAGLVLVDSSHEAAEQLVIPQLPWWIRAANRLVIPAAMVVTRKARGGADRRSLIRENRAFYRVTASDKPLAAGGLGDRPVIVITAGPGKIINGRVWQIFHGLHAELAGLSSNNRHVVASHPDHHVHKKDPDLVITAIRDVVHSARTRTPLAPHAGTGQDL